MRLEVECYAGYRGEETPRRFSLDGRRVEVVEVVDSWLAPDYRYFRLRTAEGVYILRHDMQTQAWELTMFRESSLEPDVAGPNRRQRQAEMAWRKGPPTSSNARGNTQSSEPGN